MARAALRHEAGLPIRMAVARVCASIGSSDVPLFFAMLRTSGLAPDAWITEMRGKRETSPSSRISRNPLAKAELLARLPPGTIR